MHDFAGDETAFEVAMDDASGLGCLHAFDDGPGAGFLLAGGQVGLKAKKVIDALDEK